MLSVRGIIPLDKTVDEICEMDVFSIFYYIRVIVDAVFKLKNDLDYEICKRNDAEISDYES